jgi:hypothetical protein
VSDHYHYEYASDRHDHRGEYAEDRHDHDPDYAEKGHRHYDDESTARGLREDLSRAEDRIRELEDGLRDALNRIHALEDRQPDYAGEEPEPEGGEPYCVTCGSPVGIFPGYADGWHHWRGEGTADSPVELYEAGHAPEVAWRPRDEGATGEYRGFLP